MSGSTPSQAEKPPWTDLQGQYLAFIATYALVNRRSPAEVDFQRFFCVAGPTVHRMLVELDRKGLIHRQPGKARSVQLQIHAADLPALREPESLRTPVTRH